MVPACTATFIALADSAAERALECERGPLPTRTFAADADPIASTSSSTHHVLACGDSQVTCATAAFHAPVAFE